MSIENPPPPDDPRDGRPADGVSSEPALPVRAKRRFAGRINSYPPYRSKVEDSLRDEDREEYETLVIRKTPVKKLWAWLEARGYDLGRESVRRHREKLLRDFAEVRRGADVATRYARIARTAGLTLPEATIGGFHQMLMQFFTREQTSAALTAKDMASLATAVDAFIETHQKVAQVRRELEKAGGSGSPDQAAVVDRVREILGV